MMRFCLLILVLSITKVYASTQVIMEGEFRPLTQSISVRGSGIIFQDETGNHYVGIENFDLKGGVVLDLKVCGELAPMQEACLSIAEPRYKKQLWKLPPVFLSYTKIKIFDLDLIQDLAVVKN